MKKVIFSAALACIAASSANAQTSENHSGTATVVVTDYINLTPSTGIGNAMFEYTTPAAMAAGTEGVEAFNVIASRAWKFEFSASNFNGGTPGPGVASSIPAGQILTISTTGDNTVNTLGSGNWIPATGALANVANMATGTLGSNFNLHYKVTPGLANQMSGSYTSTITQIASLN